jgi:multidrug efflux pump subunit AcrA (membrane-fusion protein)
VVFPPSGYYIAKTFFLHKTNKVTKMISKLIEYLKVFFGRTTKTTRISSAVIIALLLLWISLEPAQGIDEEIIVKPQFGQFEVTVTATGELQAKNSVKIYGPEKARQVRIYQMKINKMVSEGTVVKKGDFVAELDRSELQDKISNEQIELQKADSRYTLTHLDTLQTLSKARDDLVNLNYAKEEAKLKMEQSRYEAPAVQREAEINYEKAVRTFEQAQKNYLTQIKQSRAKMNEVKADLSQIKQRLDLYMETMATFTVKAPADGMVIYRKEWNGQKITEGSSIGYWDPVVATLPDLSEMESITYVNEVDIKKIKVGQKVNINLDADPEKKLYGDVTEIANVGEKRPNSSSKVFEVVIVINNPDSTLRPAMTTGNEIIIAVKDSSLSIPLECIHNQDSLTYVLKQNGSGFTKQEVVLDLINESSAIVTRGVEQEDELLLSIPNNIKDMELERLE